MFPQILKNLRTENKISQAELAKAIGVSQGTIYFWENAVNEPTIGYIIKLADFFGVTIEELVGLNDLKQSQNSKIEVLNLYDKLSYKNKQLAKKLLEDLLTSQNG